MRHDTNKIQQKAKYRLTPPQECVIIFQTSTPNEYSNIKGGISMKRKLLSIIPASVLGVAILGALLLLNPSDKDVYAENRLPPEAFAELSPEFQHLWDLALEIFVENAIEAHGEAVLISSISPLSGDSVDARSGVSLNWDAFMPDISDVHISMREHHEWRTDEQNLQYVLISDISLALSAAIQQLAIYETYFQNEFAVVGSLTLPQPGIHGYNHYMFSIVFASERFFPFTGPLLEIAGISASYVEISWNDFSGLAEWFENAGNSNSRSVEAFEDEPMYFNFGQGYIHIDDLWKHMDEIEAVMQHNREIQEMYMRGELDINEVMDTYYDIEAFIDPLSIINQMSMGGRLTAVDSWGRHIAHATFGHPTNNSIHNRNIMSTIHGNTDPRGTTIWGQNSWGGMHLVGEVIGEWFNPASGEDFMHITLYPATVFNSSVTNFFGTRPASGQQVVIHGFVSGNVTGTIMSNFYATAPIPGHGNLNSVIAVQTSRPLMPGDSGAAVVHNGSTAVGTFVAAGGNIAYFVPTHRYSRFVW